MTYEKGAAGVPITYDLDGKRKGRLPLREGERLRSFRQTQPNDFYHTRFRYGKSGRDISGCVEALAEIMQDIIVDRTFEAPLKLKLVQFGEDDCR